MGAGGAGAACAAVDGLRCGILPLSVLVFVAFVVCVMFVVLVAVTVLLVVATLKYYFKCHAVRTMPFLLLVMTVLLLQNCVG